MGLRWAETLKVQANTIQYEGSRVGGRMYLLEVDPLGDGER